MNIIEQLNKQTIETLGKDIPEFAGKKVIYGFRGEVMGQL